MMATLRQNAGRGGTIIFQPADWRQSGFRVRLYRFMAESIPLVNSVIWTWSRLAAAPGDYILVFEATAELVDGGRVETLSIFRFKVVDGPFCLNPLPGDVNGDCTVDEHDLRMVEDSLGKTASCWPGHDDHEEHDHDGN